MNVYGTLFTTGEGGVVHGGFFWIGHIIDVIKLRFSSYDSVIASFSDFDLQQQISMPYFPQYVVTLKDAFATRFSHRICS